MRRIASQKLMEKGLEEEETRLMELKRLLKEEFGKCLWDKCLENKEEKVLLKICIGGIKNKWD